MGIFELCDREFKNKAGLSSYFRMVHGIHSPDEIEYHFEEITEALITEKVHLKLNPLTGMWIDFLLINIQQVLADVIKQVAVNQNLLNLMWIKHLTKFRRSQNPVAMSCLEFWPF